LASLVEKNPLVRIDRERIETAVLREVAVGRPVWESRRLLDYDVSDAPNAVDAFVRDRAGESLAHVFTLLSLMLPREPLQIAFRSLIPTTSTCRAPRSSISTASCRRGFALACGRFSKTALRCGGRHGRAMKSSPNCCDRITRS
jgi:hypothetical protein